MRRSLCAICDNTNETTEICKRCKSDPANADWVVTPEWEVYGVDVEMLDAMGQGSIEYPNSRPYETDTCIQIMRWYCLGMSQRKIAAEVDCQHSFVKRTIKYWEEHRKEFLEELRKVVAEWATSGPLIGKGTE